MTYFDKFIRESVDYAMPDATIEEKYRAREMMANLIQEEPKREEI